MGWPGPKLGPVVRPIPEMGLGRAVARPLNHTEFYKKQLCMCFVPSIHLYCIFNINTLSIMLKYVKGLNIHA